MGAEGPAGMTVDDFVQLELEVWRALVTGDQSLDRSMLSEDFLGVYPSGFSDRAGHVDQLASGPTSSARLFTSTPSDSRGTTR